MILNSIQFGKESSYEIRYDKNNYVRILDNNILRKYYYIKNISSRQFKYGMLGNIIVLRLIKFNKEEKRNIIKNTITDSISGLFKKETNGENQTDL